MHTTRQKTQLPASSKSDTLGLCIGMGLGIGIAALALALFFSALGCNPQGSKKAETQSQIPMPMPLLLRVPIPMAMPGVFCFLDYAQPSRYCVFYLTSQPEWLADEATEEELKATAKYWEASGIDASQYNYHQWSRNPEMQDIFLFFLHIYPKYISNSSFFFFPGNSLHVPGYLPERLKSDLMFVLGGLEQWQEF